MDTVTIFLYVLATLAYACTSYDYRPSTVIGWGIYLFLTVCLTPLVSIPVTMAACYYMGSLCGE